MRLALDTTYSLGPRPSGVGVYSRELIGALARTHPEDRLLCYYRPHRFLKSFQDSLPSNASRRLLWGRPGGDVFHALNQRVDRRAHRTVATFHDLFVMTNEYSTPEFRERFTRQARKAAQHSDRIIAVSQFTADQVHQLLGVETDRIRVIPHGVRPPSPTLPAQPEPLILFVGAIQKRKNVTRLIRAFEQAAEELGDTWQLVLAGAPNGYGAEESLAAIEQSPLRARIDMPGYVSNAALEQLWARASLFAFPSLDEGFGIPVLEAMARGVPVITSNGSALAEVAGDAALLVDPENVDHIGRALVQLASDSELADKLRTAGRNHAAKFTWESAAERTWRVYQELL